MTHPCQSCGACCATFRVPMYWSEAEERAIDPALVEKIDPLRVAMRVDDALHLRCIALDGDIGVVTACRIYAQRPGPCRDLGAELAINYRSEDFVKLARAATGGAGVDLILDMVGGDYLARDVRALAPDGRLVMIAFLGGATAELNFAQVMTKRLTITGSTLRPRSVEAKAAIAADLVREVWPLLAAGRIAPVMDRTFPLSEAAAAHARMESSAHIGKIVLTM